MKRIISLILVLCLPAAALFSGCNNESAAPQNEILLYDFETYNPDFMALHINTNFGRVDVNTDAPYVKSGTQSAKLSLLGGFYHIDQPKLTIPFYSSLKGFNYKELSKYQDVGISVYNAEDFVMPLYWNFTFFDGQSSFVTEESLQPGGMSKNFHDHILNHIVPASRDAARPIVLNTWESFRFRVNEEVLLECANDAVKLGIDTLVLDDGWFKNRNDDTSGLGDWVVDPEKFPSFSGMVEKIRAMGLSFGIWIEPEMISEKSDLFTAHPEWRLCSGRQCSVQRNQYVLDLSNDEVVDYLFRSLSKLFSSAKISYVKWDMNRYLTEIGSPVYPAERQGEIAHRYILGVYRLYRMLRNAFR